MIVSARVFLILLAPLLLHGAPILHSDNQPGPQPEIPPLQEELAQDSWPWHELVSLRYGNPSFEDITKYFTYDFTDPRLTSLPSLTCALPFNTWYRTRESHTIIAFRPGLTILTENVIGASPAGFLILIPCGSHVYISPKHNPRNTILVPTSKIMRVVNVPLEGQNKIWGKCLGWYRERHRAIPEHIPHDKIESEARYMRHCFHDNMWFIGDRFVGLDIKYTA